MGIRSYVAMQIKAGLDNALNDLIFDQEIEEILDTMDDGVALTGELAAAASGVQLDLAGVATARFVYIEADGDFDLYFDGVAPTAATVVGSGGTYNTAFAGGETLLIEIDTTAITVTFDAADQTLTQVINRVNSAIALAGFATPGASADGGELRITSPTTGSSSEVKVTGGTGAATLGFLGTETDTGSDPGGATAKHSIEKMASSGSSSAASLKAYFAATINATNIYLGNPSASTAVRYRALILGDLTS